ncbi:MAG: hypothetical protein K0S55_131, partial [Clostridia bacterium]|nr:hypothetical protein [Clostridia bacterium]
MKNKNKKNIFKYSIVVITLIITFIFICLNIFSQFNLSNLITAGSASLSAGTSAITTDTTGIIIPTAIEPNIDSFNISHEIIPIDSDEFEITLKVQNTFETKPSDTIIIIDIANPMYSNGSDPQKLENIKREVKDLIFSLLKDPSNDNRICLIGVGQEIETFPYDFGVNTNYGMMYNETYFTEFPSIITSSGNFTGIDGYIAKIYEYIDDFSQRLQGTSGSKLSASIAKANEILNKTFSDGGPRRDSVDNEYERSIVLIGDSKPTFCGYPILDMNKDKFKTFEDKGDYIQVTLNSAITIDDIKGFDNTIILGEGKTNNYDENVLFSYILGGYLYDIPRYGGINGLPAETSVLKFKFGQKNAAGIWTEQTIVQNSNVLEFAKMAAALIPSIGENAANLYTVGYKLTDTQELYWNQLTAENTCGKYYDIEYDDDLIPVFNNIENQIRSAIKDAKVYYRLGEYFELSPGYTLPSYISYEEIGTTRTLVWSVNDAVNMGSYLGITFPVKAMSNTPLLIEIDTNLIDKLHNFGEAGYNEAIDSYIQFTNISGLEEHIRILPQKIALGCGLITIRGCLVNNEGNYINENGEVVVHHEDLLYHNGDVNKNILNSLIFSEKFIPPENISGDFKIDYDPPITYGDGIPIGDTGIEPSVYNHVIYKYGYPDFPQNPKYIYNDIPKTNVTVSSNDPFYTFYYKYKIQTAYKVLCYYRDENGTDIPIGEFVHDTLSGNNLYFEDIVNPPSFEDHKIEGYIFNASKTGTLSSITLKPNPNQNIFKFIYDSDPNTYSIKGAVSFDASTYNFINEDYENPTVYLFRKNSGESNYIYWRDFKGVLRKDGNNYIFDYNFKGLYANEKEATSLFSYRVAVKCNNNFIVKEIDTTENDAQLFTAQLGAETFNFAGSADITVQKGLNDILSDEQKLWSRNIKVYKIGNMTSNIDSDMFYAISSSSSGSLAAEHMFKASTDILPYITTLGENVYIAQRFKFNNIAIGKNTIDYINQIKFADSEKLSITDIPISGWENINRVKQDGTIVPAINPVDKEDFYVVYKLKEPIVSEVYSPVATIMYGNFIGYENLIYFKKLNDDTGIIDFSRNTTEPLTEDENEIKNEIIAYDASKEGYYFGVIDVSESIEVDNNNITGELNDSNTKINTHQFVVGETSDITLKLSDIYHSNAKVTVKLQKQDKNVYKDCINANSIKTFIILNNENIEINYNDISEGNYQIAVILDNVVKNESSTFSYRLSLSNNYQTNKYIKELFFDISETSNYLIKLNSNENLEDMNFEIFDISDPLNKIKINDKTNTAASIFLPKTGYNFDLVAGKSYQIIVNYNKANTSSTYNFKIERTFNEVIGKTFTSNLTGNCFRICVSEINTMIKLINESNVVLFTSIDNNGFKIITPYLEEGKFYYDLNTALLKSGIKYTILTTASDKIIGIQTGNKIINDNNRYTKIDNEYEVGDTDERSKFNVTIVNLNDLM